MLELQRQILARITKVFTKLAVNLARLFFGGEGNDIQQVTEEVGSLQSHTNLVRLSLHYNETNDNEEDANLF